MRGASDDEHLKFASAKNMVLASCNWRDFQTLHGAWLERGQNHAGILLVSQWIPPGERIRILLFIASAGEPGDFANQLVWLKDWR